ncbi:hypothetical protein PIROE2DRAFT_64870 [Piromyces sp. E2]|nr:hypothetical protein PIROE2DRAFT_64870 [Piromyces sp. E2]|eukprot:OUM57665.1 hypothetical protein PIROE2DRAFT_64870 [Piromyces sp. E2]
MSTSNFTTACKFIENIKPFGPNSKNFSRWRKSIKQIVETFKLTDNKDKLAVLKAVDSQYFEYCMTAVSECKDKTLDEFLDHIKIHYGFDILSDQSLNELESIKIGKRSINEYNQKVRDLLEEIDPNSKPSEQRLLYYYIKGLEGIKIHEYLILKKPKKLEDAMNYAEETYKDFSRFDAREIIIKGSTSSSSSNNYNKNITSKNYQNKQNSNKNYQSFNQNNQNTFQNQNQNYKNKNSQSQNNKTTTIKQSENQMSDIDRLIQEFASMKLHFCQILDKLTFKIGKGSSQSSRNINKIEYLSESSSSSSDEEKEDFHLFIKRKLSSSDSEDSSDEEESLSNRKKKIKEHNNNTSSTSNTTIPNEMEIETNNNEKKGKKRGRKPIFKNPTIIDPSIIENNTINSAKKINKEIRNKKRLGPDVQYDLEEGQIVKNKKNLNDILKAIYMLKDHKEYNLFEDLNNTKANISYVQLLALSPSLRKQCLKGLKINPDDIREIKTIRNCDLDDISEDELNLIINTIINELKNNNINDEQKDLVNTKDKQENENLPEPVNVKTINKSYVTAVHVELQLKFDSIKIRSIFWVLEDNDPCYDLILGRKVQKEYGLYLRPDDDLFIKKNNTDPCIAKAIPSQNYERKILKISLIDDINFKIECNILNEIKDDTIKNNIENNLPLQKIIN